MIELNSKNIKSYITKAIKKLEKSNKSNKNILRFWGKKYIEKEFIKEIWNLNELNAPSRN